MTRCIRLRLWCVVSAAVILLSAQSPMAWSQESPSDAPSDVSSASEEPVAEAPTEETSESSTDTTGVADRENATPPAGDSSEAKGARQSLLASLTIFVLAIFVGFEVITKVPPTLHTPLMSGSNAISGITIVGAVIVASATGVTSFIGFLAVIMATINVVGGFLVTHRMLGMFQKKS